MYIAQHPIATIGTSFGGASISIDLALNNRHSTVPCLCKQFNNAYTVWLTTLWKNELLNFSVLRLLYGNPFYNSFPAMKLQFFKISEIWQFKKQAQNLLLCLIAKAVTSKSISLSFTALLKKYYILQLLLGALHVPMIAFSQFVRAHSTDVSVGARSLSGWNSKPGPC